MIYIKFKKLKYSEKLKKRKILNEFTFKMRMFNFYEGCNKNKSFQGCAFLIQGF